MAFELIGWIFHEVGHRGNQLSAILHYGLVAAERVEVRKVDYLILRICSRALVTD